MASILRSRDTDMTEGSIPRLLINFAIPLLIGNVFQQLYNTVDSIVVGKFVGKQALAAVGCTGPIINMLIGLFAGLAGGAGVVISQYYGAKENEKLRRAVHTAIAFTLILCVVLTLLGAWLAPELLKLMDTPDEVFVEAVEYLRIYFWGLTGLLLYNIGSGILRAVGDSTHPLYFLIFSAVTNTVLDLVFVAVFDMGIAGAAIATILAQFMSAVLTLRMLMRSKEDYRISVRDIGLDKRIFAKICSIGIPSAIQMAVTAFSNIFVQSYINHFDTNCIAGWTAYNKIDAFAMQPMMSLSMALTTFVGQNLGAGKADRAKAGTKTGLKLGLAIMITLLIPLMVFAPQLTGLFNDDKQVVEFGTLFMRLISPFYVCLCINQVYSGSLRGAGDTRATMFIMLGSFVAFRQIYLFITYRLGGGIIPIALGYPAGWIICSTLLLIYYHSGKWQRKIRV